MEIFYKLCLLIGKNRYRKNAYKSIIPLSKPIFAIELVILAAFICLKENTILMKTGVSILTVLIEIYCFYAMSAVNRFKDVFTLKNKRFIYLGETLMNIGVMLNAVLLWLVWTDHYNSTIMTVWAFSEAAAYVHFQMFEHFGDESYVSGYMTVDYSDIDEVKLCHSADTIEGTFASVLLYKNGECIGCDKFTYNGYLTLLNKIENYPR